jgi:hypothetical protein
MARPSFLPLGATAQGELWPPEQSAAILLYFLSLFILRRSSRIFSNHLSLGLRVFLVQPSEADYLVSEQFSFYGVSFLASRPAPNLEDQSVPLRLAPIL